MVLPNKFLIKVSKTISNPQRPLGDLTIVINRPYAELETELKQVFEGKENVKMFVDRRYKERRTNPQTMDVEFRKTERRNGKEGLLEAIISL